MCKIEKNSEKTERSLLKFHLVKALWLFLWALLAMTTLFCSEDGRRAAALVRIDVNQGNVEPIPVAITRFSHQDESSMELAFKLAELVGNDLESSGFFRTINREAFLQNLQFGQMPHFDNWRKINAAMVIMADVTSLGGRRIRVRCSLWDPYTEANASSKVFEVDRNQWRRVGHKIADQIYHYLVGEQGYFDSKIVYVAQNKAPGSSVRNPGTRLAIMDQDGANLRFLSDGKDLVMTPRFDPTSHRVAYISFKNKAAEILILDLDTGAKRVAAKLKGGISFAPRFSPDGRKLVLSIAKDGTTSIFEMELQNGNLRRLQQDLGRISTSPSYAPDGNQIAFHSDRDGTQQIYVMSSNGGNIRKISHGDGIYATPVWSPRGDFIAFTKILNDRFYIGVMRSDGSGERLLTTSWLEEGPTWSPNGRFIMFFRKNKRGESRIYSVDLTGYNERAISTAGNASDPAWSGLLRN